MTMQVTFWGTRGGVPVSGPGYAKHGGSTTCFEIQLPPSDEDRPDRLIIDCGTGLVELGHRRETAGAIDNALFLQTHMHWDHVQGFPFFTPFFDADASFEFWGVDRGGRSLAEVYAQQMTEPTFPVSIDAIEADLEFISIDEEGVADLGDVRIQWTEVKHPAGSSAFRIEDGENVFVFSGDVEVRKGCFETLIELAEDADVFAMDAQYFPEEYPGRQGFGHSTFTDAVKVAREAGVDRLFLSHHDPRHDDNRLDRKAAMARELAEGEVDVQNARDGLSVAVCGKREDVRHTKERDEEPARR